MSYSLLTLPDGVQLAYQVLGSEHVGHTQPLVLVAGTSMVRTDWEGFSKVLSESRPVLVYDHRGIGDSTFSKQDNLTMESMARDLLHLIRFLGWSSISILGFSLGGVLTQHLLLTLPPLPFRITHVILAGTLATPIKAGGQGLRLQPTLKPGETRSNEETLEMVRETLASTMDPIWLGDPKNKDRFDALLHRTISARRPALTIRKQAIAVVKGLSFGDTHKNLPRSTQVLVIHGTRDTVIPFTNGTELLDLIPWAKMVEVGPLPGQLPHLDVGHCLFDYYDTQTWKGVIETFLQHTQMESKL